MFTGSGRLLLIIISGAVVLGVAAVALSLRDGHVSSDSGGRETSSAASQPAGSNAPGGRAGGLPSCGKRTDFFTVSPVALSDFQGLIPLGNLKPPDHTFPTDHVYFFLNRTDPRNPESAAQLVPVVSPGDVWITSIRSSERVSEGSTDYAVHFSPCRELEAYFLHVSSLSEQLEQHFTAPFERCDEYTTGGNTYRNCEKRVSIRVSAGEIIGTAGGGPMQNALDLGAYDSRAAPLAYANPSRWHFSALHVVCPIDYFEQSTRKALEERFSDSSGTTRRAARPVCGQVEQDEPGTAQGVWFVNGVSETYPEDPHLALVHDNVDPTISVFSVGTSLRESGLEPGLYYFEPETSGMTNRDFGYLQADGSVYCYELRGRFENRRLPFVVLLELAGSTKLLAERRASTACGTRSWSLTSSATEFTR